MFGSGSITSSWGNSNNNQQQQPSAFGQPNAFGSTGFGTNTGTSAFGQPAQPANSMFGGATPNTGGAFGNTFGATNTNNAVNPMFGAAKPATGFGAFGGGTTGTTGTFGGGTSTTSAFGTPNNAGTSAFGQPSNTTSAFGGGGGSSIFGAKPATSAFGAAATPTATNQPVTTGSSNPAYSETQEKDTATTGAVTTLRYQSISCMPAYLGTSFEELRYQDYQQNRKTAGATTSAFGQTAFGGNQATGSSIFGGQNNQQNTQTNSIFGARPANTGFGGTGAGAFGQPNTGTTSAFGSTSNNITGVFGQPQPTQPAGAFGTFGQPAQSAQPAQQTSAFGTNTGTGAFGSTGTGAFGSTPNTGNSIFGQPNNQQQPQQTNSIFGQPSTNTTGTGTFGAFGANNNNQPKTGIFGAQPAQPAATTSFGSSIFGASSNNQQSQPPQSNSLFGSNANTGTGLFGNTNNQQPANTGTSLFGNNQNTGSANTGGGLFGGGGGFGLNNQNQQQNQQPATTGFGGGGLFGNKPAGTTTGTGGLFGGGNTFGAPQPASNTGGGLFGSTLGQSTAQPQQTGGLFGNKAPAMGQSASTGGGAGLFGSFNVSANTLSGSTAVPGAQGTLTASISQPIATTLPIFSMLPPGPRAADLEQSMKKKPSMFVDMPTRSLVPHLSYTPTNSKLRGFGSSTSKNVLFNSTSSNNLIASRSQSPSIFGPVPSSPSLGSGQRKSVKKLILDKKVEPTDLFVKTNDSPGKIVFSPALGISAREKEAAALLASPAPPAKLPTPPRPPRTPKKFTASQQNDGADVDLEEGDYYVKPDLAALKNAGYDQLTAFKNLVVGRVGYGEIHFLEPVDLTGLPKLGALLGEVIRFEEKECSVYPDSEEVDKPPSGEGLNVRARIILQRCWATGKAHREPIKDENNPIAIKHLKRLKNMKETHFESFDIAEGVWTFTVDHF